MSRYRFAFRPGWILSHLFVFACVAAFIWAGFWQLRRLDERRTSNALVTARMTAEPVPLAQALAADPTVRDPDAVAYRRVTVTGTYQADQQVLISNRTNGGSPGFWVVTPVRQADGSEVVVNRGWIPLPYGDGGSPDVYRPPSGQVTVTGIVRPTQIVEGLEVADPADGRLTTMIRVDLPRLAKQIPATLVPVYVDLAVQSPPQPEGVPAPVPAPPLDEGSHFSYACQWFLFATLTCIVYPLLLRRTARHKEADAKQAAVDLLAGPAAPEGELVS